MSKTRWVLVFALVLIGIAWTPVAYKLARWWAWQTYEQQVEKKIADMVKQECLK